MSETEQEQSSFLESFKLWNNPNILQDVIKEMDNVIKEDYPCKLSVFFTGISAYLKEPLNTFIRAASGLGKTWNTTKALDFMPETNVLMLGGLSPTALVHEYGTRYSLTGEKLDDLEKPNKKEYENQTDYKAALHAWKEKLRESYIQVDLQGKILVFLESPHPKTFNVLRPILSHDKYRISFRITDKTNKGTLQTKHIVIQGWPATIFLNAQDQYIEELATRSFTVSPMQNPEKYVKANVYTTEKANMPWIEDERLSRLKIFQTFFGQLQCALESRDVIIPFANLHMFYPAEIPRDMRDYQHLLQFIKCITALHFYQRVLAKHEGKEYLLANSQDVMFAWLVFNLIFETTRAGISQHLLDFYHQIIEQRPKWNGEELTTAYNEAYKPKRSKKTIQRWLGTLEDLGYITCEEDTEDKRKNNYIPLMKKNGTNRDKTENIQISLSDLQNGFKTWLEQSGQKLEFFLYKNREGIAKGRYEQASMGEVEKYVIVNQQFCPDLIQLISRPKTETVVKNEANSEMSLSVPNFVGSCWICGKLLPQDLVGTTVDEGRTVHLECYKKLKEWLKHE